MPRKERLNYDLLREELQKLLGQSGPSAAKSLCRTLGISQPTLSRLLASLEKRILRAGKGSQTLYALKGALPAGQDQVPVYTIDEKGAASQAANLLSIQPRGYYLESVSKTIASRFHKGLPYLFEDLRPSGFLGRLVPRLHPDLEAPNDVRDWNDAHCLLYWIRYGWNLVGNFIIGEGAFERYMESKLHPPDRVREEERATHYGRLAEAVMTRGVPGSSAGGEQAKFLATCVSVQGARDVLVKFSPPTGETIGHRIADLLVCEHLAHETLRAHGKISARSEVVLGEPRLFLQIDRFDRTGKGRKGLLSLLPLDREFIGTAKSWSETSKGLLSLKKIDAATHRGIVWLESFGRLIGNTDMHLGNVSLFAQGEKILGLAPVYDMLPMLYAPQQNQLVDRVFDPPPPRLAEAPVWTEALEAAIDFWKHVQTHPLISEDFKRMTAENGMKLAKLSGLGALLPLTTASSIR